jgi:[acyl-carrier-protein] S-malonyltransferase
VCAGALALGDAIRLVALRARLMREAAPPRSAMAAVVGCSAHIVERACREHASLYGEVSVANYNSYDQTVITGAGAAVNAVCEFLERAGPVVHRLDISVPGHSPLLARAVPLFEQALSSIAITTPRWPVLANATLEPFVGGDPDRRWLATQLIQPVRWVELMERVVRAAPDAVVEVGPRPVLRDLFRRQAPDVPAFAFTGAEAVDLASLTLAEAQSAEVGSAARAFFGHALAAAAATRNECFDDPLQMETILARHGELRRMHRRWLDDGTPVPTAIQLRQVAALLREILRAKRVPEPERRIRFDDLFRLSATRALFSDFEP